MKYLGTGKLSPIAHGQYLQALVAATIYLSLTFPCNPLPREFPNTVTPG